MLERIANSLEQTLGSLKSREEEKFGNRYHDPEDFEAGLHPLSDSPPSKGERK